VKYDGGGTLKIGDAVELAGKRGHVWAIIDEGQFSARCPRDAWAYLRHGAMLEVEGYGFLWYEKTEDTEAAEDLVLIACGKVPK
jgi:hypothetical protein